MAVRFSQANALMLYLSFIDCSTAGQIGLVCVRNCPFFTVVYQHNNKLREEVAWNFGLLIRKFYDQIILFLLY